VISSYMLYSGLAVLALLVIQQRKAAASANI